jgi:hypothetical protein
MLCVAAVSALVLHAAVLLLPLPVSATALQPLIEFAPSLKLTLPLGLLPATVAVNVTLVPTVDGFFELASDVVVGAGPAELTTCDRLVLFDARLLASPPYDATMVCVATDSVLVVHAAVRLLPLPASATALQPAIEAPPSLKLMLPVGAMPTTVAVKVTLAPNVDGFFELATVVVLDALLTTCESTALLEALLPAPPLYAATRLCVPAPNALLEHCAVRVLPEPLSVTAPQPATVLPASVKFTVPVGAVPVTLAVNVTVVPSVEGFTELASVVVVGLPGPSATVTSSEVGDADPTVMVMP